MLGGSNMKIENTGDIEQMMASCLSEKVYSEKELQDNQVKWDRRFMDLAKMISSWSSCVRDSRQVGSVIVKDKRIITTGYNGAPAGIMSCQEKGYCMRTKLGIASGTRAEVCFSIHAEQNALMQAVKLGISLDGATCYVTHRPCTICSKLLINSGIKRIVYGYDYPDNFSVKLLSNANIKLEHIPYDE